MTREEAQGFALADYRDDFDAAFDGLEVSPALLLSLVLASGLLMALFLGVVLGLAYWLLWLTGGW